MTTSLRVASAQVLTAGVTAAYWAASLWLLYRTESPARVLVVVAVGAAVQGWLLGLGVRTLIHTLLSLVAFTVLTIAFGYAAYMPFIGGCLVFGTGAAVAGALQAKGMREAKIGPLAAILGLGGGVSFLLLGGLVGANRSMAFASFALAMGAIATGGTLWSVSRYPPKRGVGADT
jgi:hypothetical protein